MTRDSQVRMSANVSNQNECKHIELDATYRAEDLLYSKPAGKIAWPVLWVHVVRGRVMKAVR